MDVYKIRENFPILKQQAYGKTIVYLDNAATTQKPLQVINSLVDYYSNTNANIHRGVHFLSQKATEEFENSRKYIQEYINAKNNYEIIFTRGATESINLVASTFGRKYINQGDEIILTALEHHSNIVPWQMICEEKNAKLKIIPINENGEVDINVLEKLINEKTRLVAVSHVSNALGIINPVKNIINIAHKANVPVLIDGAQAIPHINVDVQELDCDFYCFSGHKVYAPMGIGVLYGKEKWLEDMPPYMGGGEMIKTVTFDKTVYNELPYKFEAGTPNVGDTIALKVALSYLKSIGIENIHKHEYEILQYAANKLKTIDSLKIYGESEMKSAVISFIVGKIHPYDMGTILDKLGIAVRTGNHCAQPLMDCFKIPGTVRASFALYNTKEEVDILIDGIYKAKKMLE